MTDSGSARDPLDDAPKGNAPGFYADAVGRPTAGRPNRDDRARLTVKRTAQPLARTPGVSPRAAIAFWGAGESPLPSTEEPYDLARQFANLQGTTCRHVWHRLGSSNRLPTTPRLDLDIAPTAIDKACFKHDIVLS